MIYSLNRSVAGALSLAARWSVGRAALTLGVLGLLAWALLGLSDMGHVLGTARAIWSRPDLLALFAVSYSAAFALRAVAWRVLLVASPGIPRLFGFLQAASLANHLFPTKVGELVRIGLLARTGVPLAQAASSTLLARLLDLGSLCLLVVAWAPLAGARSGALVVALVLPIVLVLLAATVLHALATGRLSWVWASLPQRLAAVGRPIEAAVQAIPPRRALLALVIVLPSWMLEALALWTVAEAAGLALSLPLASTATAFTIAFQGFQVTPGGIGLYEASLTGVLTLYGLEPGAALALAVTTHALKFAYAYGVGLLCLGAEAVHDVGGVGPQWLRPRLASVRRWADPALMLALLALALASPLGVPLLPPALATGVLAALPLVVLGRCHHLPGPLLPLLLIPPALFVALVGVPSPVAALVALLLGGLAVALGAVRLVPALWAVWLSQAIVAGAGHFVELALFGTTAFVVLVVVRQWWTSHHPLPPPAPVSPGSTIAVVIPVHDEAASIAGVVAGIPRESLAQRGFATLVLVVDDGSRDDSASVAQAAGADLVIRHPSRLGLGAALRTGLQGAREAGAAAVVYLDGDGEYDPSDIPQVAAPVLSGHADYVLGARFPHRSSAMRRTRRQGNRAFTLLLRVLTGRSLADGQTGFRALGPRSLATAEIIHDYNYAQVLTLDLLRKGLRLAEVPIAYRTRQTGQSFIRYGEYMRRVLPAIARELLAP